MTWHPTTADLRVGQPWDSQSLTVDLPASSRGYLTWERRDTRFNSPPESPAFESAPGTDIVVRVPIASVHEGVTARLCVLVYVDGAETPERHWAEAGETSVELTVPEGVASTSLALLLNGRGSVEVSSPEVVTRTTIAHWSAALAVEPGQRVGLTFKTVATIPEANGGLVTVQFLDQGGEVLLPSPELATNLRLGNYFYLDTAAGRTPSETDVWFTAPARTQTVLLQGRQWRPDNTVSLVAEPRVTIRSGGGHKDHPSLETTLARLRELPRESPLIVLYTTAPPVGHPTLSLRPNRLALEYRKRGYDVVFFPFSRVSDDQRVTAEGVLQFGPDEVTAAVNVLAGRWGGQNVFICSSYPSITGLTTVDLLKASGWRTMYEVRDEMEDFNRVGYSKWFDPELERQVVNRVDSIVTVSPRLAEKMQIISRGRREPIVVQNAAPPALIEKGAPLRTLEVARGREEHGIIGYIGHLTDSWFDWDLVVRTAAARPDFRFEIIGHGMPSSVELPENVKYLGPRPHDEFVDISRRWVAGIIPFQESPLTYAVDPNKIYEYLAVGLRTITAPMGAVASCPSTFIYTSPDQFADAIESALTHPFTENEVRDINDYVATAGWGERAQQMLALAGLDTTQL